MAAPIRALGHSVLVDERGTPGACRAAMEWKSGWLWSVVLLGCACSDPAVTSATPNTGPYGTTVTLRGHDLDLEEGRVVFENGTEVTRESELVRTWGDSTIAFRVPTPAAGTFRVIGGGLLLDAGRFDPSPWSPFALSLEEAQRSRLDWAALDEDTLVEVFAVDSALEIQFVDRDGTRAVHSLGVEAGSVELVVTGPDTVEGYFFDAREREELGWFAASQSDIEFAIGELPDDADVLLAADRDEQGTYVWLSDADHEELWQWRVADGALFEARVVADPADPTSSRRIAAARGQHLWRVWEAPQNTLLDQYFSVMGAYLAPDASSLTPPQEFGSADDSASLVTTHGVSDDGLVAVEFCGTDVSVRAPTQRTCGSLIASSAGVRHKDQGARDAPRTLYYALDGELAALECVEGVHGLRWLDSPDTPLDPVFAPCLERAPAHTIDANGAPSFETRTPAGTFVLSRE